MRAILAGAALAAFVITPSLADYYIIRNRPRSDAGSLRNVRRRLSV
jgi:hypothetical protein